MKESDDNEKEIYKYYPLIDLLSDDTKKKIMQTNILELIHVDPDSLQLLNENNFQ